jgi:glycosyltransferase involved in cell wall biosynthesis
MSCAALTLPQLQFVSKPMAPPFRDGSKCLVRDLCLHLETVTPHVMGTGERVQELGDRVVHHAIYGSSGNYSPSALQNLRAAAYLLFLSRADLWHFVFSPNARSSQVGATLRRLRGVPTVQTIASPPRSFEEPEKLLFGDVIVAQSAWTRTQFEAALARSTVQPRGTSQRRIETIAPPAPHLDEPTEERVAKERARLGLSDGEALFVYPGDLEVSSGAAHMIEWAPSVRERIPGARVLLAYRNKTEKAEARAQELRERADTRVVELQPNVPDIHALLKLATAIVFPVDDLYGKVDLPIVLLEALRLGTPVLALDEGPLKSLEGALRLADDPREWLDAMARITADVEFRAGCVAQGKRAVDEHYSPAQIARQYEKIYEDLLSVRR